MNEPLFFFSRYKHTRRWLGLLNVVHVVANYEYLREILMQENFVTTVMQVNIT